MRKIVRERKHSKIFSQRWALRMVSRKLLDATQICMIIIFLRKSVTVLIVLNSMNSKTSMISLTKQKENKRPSQHTNYFLLLNFSQPNSRNLHQLCKLISLLNLRNTGIEVLDLVEITWMCKKMSQHLHQPWSTTNKSHLSSLNSHKCWKANQITKNQN